jgi:hypothetical protein
MSHTLIVSALAQTTLLTSPRIAPASWHPVRTSVVGPASGSRWTRLELAGLSRGTAITSMKSPTGSSLGRVPSTQPALLELLL